jgi:hypothetical protein
MSAMSFWGGMEFSNEEGDHGRQVGHEMVQIQWQGAGDQLERQIVWPTEAQTTDFQAFSQ